MKNRRWLTPHPSKYLSKGGGANAIVKGSEKEVFIQRYVPYKTMLVIHTIPNNIIKT